MRSPERLIRKYLLIAMLAPAMAAHAVVNLPTITTAIPDMTFPGAGSQNIDLREHFGIDFVEPGNPDRSTIIQFTVQAGADTEVFNILMFPRQIAPRTFDNFLAYVDAQRYDNVIFHRSAFNFALQGGGYFPDYPEGFPEDFPTGEPTDKVETFDPIPVEYNLPNSRGRVSMARTADPNSATSQFFINVADNSSVLSPSGGDGYGYAAFANVMSFGMDAVLNLAAIPAFNAGGVFSEVPLVDFDNTANVDPVPANFVTMTSVRRAEVYPGGTLPAVLSYEVISSDETIATAAIVENELTVTATGATGTALITVISTDTSLAQASDSFKVTVGDVPPQPAAFASLSTRGLTLDNDAVVIAGFQITGPDPKRVLVRTVGPTLLFYGVNEALVAPTMTLTRILPTGNEQIVVNDDWELNENADEIRLVTSQVGAFPLVPNFGDAAVLETLPPGSYTVTASGLGGETGICLVEMYDADFGTNGSELASISSRVPIAVGNGVAIMGFVVDGTGPRTYLIRVAGPKLGSFGVPTVIVDPELVVFRAQSGGDVEMGRNDNWEDDDAAAITAASEAVGAFPFDPGGLDSAILLNLQPGVYTVLGSGVDQVVGTGLIEIYRVPDE